VLRRRDDETSDAVGAGEGEGANADSGIAMGGAAAAASPTSSAAAAGATALSAIHAILKCSIAHDLKECLLLRREDAAL
jgi:hypothetical protein